MTNSDYLYPNADAAALDRLRGLEQIEDAGTIEALTDLGDLSGWRCLEIGAGAGSIARWLAERVGPGGHVLATDLDTRLLASIERTNLEVRQHDIARDPLSESAFDLIHVRHVLIHLADRTASAMASMAQALRPGGILLCEESDFRDAGAIDPTPSDLRQAYDAGLRALVEMYGRRGMNVRLGSALPDLAADCHLRIRLSSTKRRRVQGGSVEALYSQSTLALAGPALLEGGYIDSAGLEQALAAHADPRLVFQTRATRRIAAYRP